MATCWACGGAPPSWACTCEECGGRGVDPTSTREEMERVERDYWCGSTGQFSNPFRSRAGCIVPPNSNPLLLRV
jgi:hypothetical protein